MAANHAAEHAGARPRVLFLCTGNSCRSQMAEGWAKALRADVLRAYSAGTEPHGMNRLAIACMAEAGVDITSHTSKHARALQAELGENAFDYVITVCDSAHEACPVFLGAPKVMHFGFDDPPRLAKGAQNDEEALVFYRRVRDEIKAFVEKLPGLLTGDVR